MKEHVVMSSAQKNSARHRAFHALMATLVSRAPVHICSRCSCVRRAHAAVRRRCAARRRAARCAANDRDLHLHPRTNGLLKATHLWPRRHIVFFLSGCLHDRICRCLQCRVCDASCRRAVGGPTMQAAARLQRARSFINTPTGPDRLRAPTTSSRDAPALGLYFVHCGGIRP